MDFSNEPYVRLYTRDSTTWKRLTWQARAVFPNLLRKLDRAGLLPLDGMEPAAAIALHTELPLDLCEAALPSLLQRMKPADPDSAVLQVTEDCLIAPRFIEANESLKSDKQRQRDSRARRRDQARASVTMSRGVTDVADVRHECHVVTPTVTLNLCSAEPVLDPLLSSAPDRTAPEEESREATRAVEAQPPQPRCEVVEIRPGGTAAPTIIAETTPEARRASKLLAEALAGKTFSAYSKAHAQSLHVLGGKPDSEWRKAKPVLARELEQKVRDHSPDMVERFWDNYYALGISPPTPKPKGLPAKTGPGDFVPTQCHLPDLSRGVGT